MSSVAKVGAFFVAVLVLAAILIWQIQGLRIGKSGVQRISVTFPDVAGLSEKSTVRLAGVPVGKVRKIRLDSRGHAIVDLDIDEGVDLRMGASASIANLGLLGEKYVELIPGPVGGGALPEGSVLRGEAPVSFDEITKLARDIELDIKSISRNLSTSLGGPEGEERLRTIVENVRIITDDLRVMIASNRGNVDATAANFREFSGMMTKLVDRIDRLVASNEANVTGSIANVREITQKLQTTADNLNQITGKIREGQGTVGKLVETDETHKNLNDALVSVKEGIGSLTKALGTVGRTKFDLGLRSELLTRSNHGKGYMTLDIQPPESPRFYRIEVASEPFGRRVQDVTTYTVTFPDGHTENFIVDKQDYKYDFAISALFGWRWKNLAVRGGVIESTGGAGLDYSLLKDRLRFSADVWDFNHPSFSAHAKLSTRYYFSPSVYATAGWDDFLNRSRGADSLFFGAGVRWTDDDIKYLLGSSPIKP